MPLESEVSFSRKSKTFMQCLLWIFKLLLAVAMAYFWAVFAQVILAYGHFSFLFVFLTVFLAFLHWVKRLTFWASCFTAILIVSVVFFVHIYIMKAYYQ